MEPLADNTLLYYALQNVMLKKIAAKSTKQRRERLEPPPIPDGVKQCRESLEPPPIPDGIVAFLLQNSPSAKVDITRVP